MWEKAHIGNGTTAYHHSLFLGVFFFPSSFTSAHSKHISGLEKKEINVPVCWVECVGCWWRVEKTRHDHGKRGTNGTNTHSRIVK